MGTWGLGIMDNDVACDVQARFDELMDQGRSVSEAVDLILKEQGPEADDPDDYPDLILALAWLASSRGTVPTQLADRAREVISSGMSIGRWSESPDQPQRRQVEDDLLVRLSAPAKASVPNKQPRRPRKLPYQEGDWIAVPLDDGGFAVGLIARADGKGKLLMYFFGPRRTKVPAPDDIRTLTPKEAIAIHFCGDPGILMGRWKVLFRDGTWVRTEWPVPAFGFEDRTLNMTYRRIYAEDTLKFIRQERVPRSVFESLPRDGLGSARSAEVLLTHLLTRISR